MKRKKEDKLKELLEKPREIDKKIKALKEERERTREEMEYVHAIDYSKPIVKRSTDRGAVEALENEIDRIEGEILKQTNILIEAKKTVKDIISLLEKKKHKDVMEQRYVNIKTWEEVGGAVGYDKRHAERLGVEAMKELRGKLRL